MQIPTLFKSKRFWVLIVSLVAFILKEETGLALDVEAWSNLVLAVIAGYSIEDWIEAWHQSQSAPNVGEN